MTETLISSAPTPPGPAPDTGPPPAAVESAPGAGAAGASPLGENIVHLAADLQLARAEVERYRRLELELREQARVARFVQAQREFLGALNDLVRAGRLEPQARDRAQAAVAVQAPAFETELHFSAGLVRHLLQGTARPLPRGETAADATLRDLAASHGPLPLDELQREVGRLTATGHYTVAEAQAHLLATDKNLAARWMQEVNKTLPPEVQS